VMRMGLYTGKSTEMIEGKKKMRAQLRKQLKRKKDFQKEKGASYSKTKKPGFLAKILNKTNKRPTSTDGYSLRGTRAKRSPVHNRELGGRTKGGKLRFEAYVASVFSTQPNRLGQMLVRGFGRLHTMVYDRHKWSWRRKMNGT